MHDEPNNEPATAPTSDLVDRAALDEVQVSIDAAKDRLDKRQRRLAAEPDPGEATLAPHD